MKKIVTVGTNAFAVVLLARRVFCVFGLVAVVLGTVGCSTTTPMALSRNSQSINTPMGLLVIETTSNLQGPINGHLKPYVLDFSATQDGKPFRYSIERDLYPSYANLIVTNDTLVHLVSIPLVSFDGTGVIALPGKGNCILATATRSLLKLGVGPVTRQTDTSERADVPGVRCVCFVTHHEPSFSILRVLGPAHAAQRSDGWRQVVSQERVIPLALGQIDESVLTFPSPIPHRRSLVF